jgi:hypothetical protein
MTDRPDPEDKPSARGDAAWKQQLEAIAASNQAAKKAGRERREAWERRQEEVRRAAETRRHAELLGHRRRRP